jgi:putative aldouronate transport system permease protein
LAALTSIDTDLYEAADIDGANGWHKLWSVTIPGMMPVIGIQLILNMGSLIKDDFDQIYAMVGGENYALRNVTEVFSSLIFRQLQAGPAGYSPSTAVGLIQSLLSLGLVLIANHVVRKTDNPGLW